MQAAHPVSQREGILLAQALHIAHLEAAHLGCLQYGTDRHQFAIGKHNT